MQWSDQAIILRLRKYGEQSGILTVLTREHGLHSGMIRSAFGKNRGIYQQGNIVEVTWQGRMPEHLGSFQCDLTDPVAAKILHDPLCLSGISTITALLEKSLPEHEPHEHIFSLSLNILALLTQEHIHAITWLEALVRLEIELLTELGFGLDISSCAATGTEENLCYVSPKSGRAISEDAGMPYRDKLLALPGFLRYTEAPVCLGDILHGLQLTGYFLNRYLFLPQRKTLPDTRGRLIHMIQSELVVENS